MPLIDPGQKAPAFTLPDQRGIARSPADFAGRPLVLYFYPKDDTDGCTKQACQFRDALPDFSKLGAAVLGISPDPVASHRRFADKHDLPFPLLADEPASDKAAPAVCDRFGVWQEKSMYGRKYMGVVRTTYLIGADGRVLRRWDKVSVADHADEVIEALRAPGGASGKAATAAPAKKTGTAKKTAAKKKPAAAKKVVGKLPASKSSKSVRR